MATIQIASLQPSDHDEWERLARGYKAFYRTELPQERYDETWKALLAGERIHGLGARIDGGLAGIAHYLFHAQTWSSDCCYLQDLFTAEEARGQGVASALIDAVAEAARTRGAVKFYWLTKQDNERARALYDRLAAWKGFLRYDYPL
ncbi:MAG: GNAT family N-acetyltransferase [Alphaproteobacteria bacterium]|nr:MAG: GNAT family N-acetyltransferase [Alphaproteobacteria bacterium]